MVELAKNKKRPNYTSKTLQHFRGMGFPVDKVEQWIPRAKKRRDLFGIIDIIVLTPSGVLGIQSTGPSGYSSHLKEMTGNKSSACVDWLLTPGTKLQLWAWRKVKEGRREIWRPKVKYFSMDDFI